jgi:hypothetical protein
LIEVASEVRLLKRGGVETLEKEYLHAQEAANMTSSIQPTDEKTTHGDTTNVNSSDADTLSSSYEAKRENLRNSNPRGLSGVQSGIDVDQAEQDFAELSRRLSGISQQSKRLSRQTSGKSSGFQAPGDVEKSTGSSDSDEPWDLETALRGSQNADHEAGIKPKHIGALPLSMTSSLDLFWLFLFFAC